MSIPWLRRRPLHRAPHARDVDSIEQHRELGRLDAQLLGAVFNDRDAKAAGLEPLVEHHETTVVPGEDLHAVAPARDEDEECAPVHVFLPRALNQAHQPVDAPTQIDGLRGEQDPQCRRQQQHGYFNAAISSPTKLAETPAESRT